MKFERRIREMIETADRTTCWPYWGTINNDGYASISFWGGGRGRSRIGSRWAYEILTGQKVPDGLVCDHLCRNRACVNPFHIEVVTHRENLRRGVGNAGKTHCRNGHPLSGDNLGIRKATKSQPYGQRFCRICFNASAREHMRRKRAAKAAGGGHA